MNDYIFSIDNKDFVIPNDYLTKSSFIIKSSPKNYDFIIDDNIPTESILNVLNENNKNVLFIDKNVFELYFSNVDFCNKNIYLFDAIEENKNVESALKLISYLEKIEFTKKETLIVVGGGIVQDIGAFVGAAFKRGIKWVFYPTTLLSMCDSCIGGKTGLNYKGVKNQIALFSSPSKVVLNVKFINTLNNNEIRSGLGEISKLCLTGGKYFFDLYNTIVVNGKVNDFNDYLKLILSSLYVKKDVIEEDEFEFNYRKSLNYGHTLGHAIEVMSSYKIPHGQAVTMGTIIANELACIYGYLDRKICDDIKIKLFNIIDKNDLKEINIDRTLELIKKDKKVQGNELTLVAIKDVGITIFIKLKIDSVLFDHIKSVFEKDFYSE